MGVFDVAGELFGFSDAKGWQLEGIDNGFGITFKGDFLAENQTETIGSVLGESSSINTASPNFQWLHGEAEPFSFTARLFASTAFQNVKQQVELLKSFARRDEKLKRAPQFVYTSGTEIGFSCFVRGVRFLYDELRSDGTLRGAVVSITLQKIADTVTEEAGSSLAGKIKSAAGIIAGAAGIISNIRSRKNVPGASPHTINRTIITKQGDTFEKLAAREYGNALKGDILRRAQPDKVDFKPNTVIDLLDRTEVIQIVVTPQSIALKDTPENLALRELKLAARNRPTSIFI